MQNNTSNQDSYQDWTFKTEEEIAAEHSVNTSTSTAIYFVSAKNDPTIVTIMPDHLVKFSKDGVDIGILQWGKETGMTFEGAADISARAMFDALKFYIDSYFDGKINEFQYQVRIYMDNFK